MTEPYVGQILFGAFNFAPAGYALCDGATMTIQQNAALASLLGSTFGGDNRTFFKLPDLRGRVAVGQGVSPVSGAVYTTGTCGGAEAVTLTAAQLPAHSHQINATTKAGTVPFPNNIPATTVANTATGSVATTMYAPAATLVSLNSLSISDVGGGGAHPNMQPFQVANAIIAVTGLYPQRP
jgi:microcystin-dependent protein